MRTAISSNLAWEANALILLQTTGKAGKVETKQKSSKSSLNKRWYSQRFRRNLGEGILWNAQAQK